MATTAADPTFVDTKILANADVSTAPSHAGALRALDGLARSGVPLRIGRQILREYPATLGRPRSSTPPQPASVVMARVQSFEARSLIAEDGPAVTAALLQRIARTPVGGRRVHDANIAATMQVHAIGTLPAFDVADLRRFAPIITLTSP